jgi:acetamidase/formamidase
VRASLPAVILQPGTGPIAGQHYLRSTPETVTWGRLPARGFAPVLTLAGGDVVTVDTVSHEGMLEDFGYDPIGWFGRHGVPAADVLDDVRWIASDMRRPAGAGPHVVTGPIAVDGAEPGDLLRVELLECLRRVPYGVISNRHGFGALAGEMPEITVRAAEPSWERPESYGTVSVFCPVEERAGTAEGVIGFGGDGRAARFPLAPFPGIVGVAVDAADPPSSTPPGRHGGNLDIAALTAGATIYLPVQVPGAGLYFGDPHFAQGNGEVSLTALEGSLRVVARVSVLRGDAARAAAGVIVNPFGESDEHWIAVGLDVDLGEAMRDAVRQALRFLETHLGMERHLAYAYLSAAADFEVSQVVDGVQGIHCRIRKRDFA